MTIDHIIALRLAANEAKDKFHSHELCEDPTEDEKLEFVQEEMRLLQAYQFARAAYEKMLDTVASGAGGLR